MLTVFVVAPALAVIVTSPALTPVTTPFSSTVAIAASLDVYVTFVPSGLTVALIASVAPTATSLAAETVSDGFLTVIVEVSVFFTVFPFFLAVTLTVCSPEAKLKKCCIYTVSRTKNMQNYIK